MLAMGTVTRDCEPISIHDDYGDPLADFRPWQPANITVGGPEDKAKIVNKIRKIQKVGLLYFNILSIKVENFD